MVKFPSDRVLNDLNNLANTSSFYLFYLTEYWMTWTISLTGQVSIWQNSEWLEQSRYHVKFLPVLLDKILNDFNNLSDRSSFYLTKYWMTWTISLTGQISTCSTWQNTEWLEQSYWQVKFLPDKILNDLNNLTDLFYLTKYYMTWTILLTGQVSTWENTEWLKQSHWQVTFLPVLPDKILNDFNNLTDSHTALMVKFTSSWLHWSGAIEPKINIFQKHISKCGDNCSTCGCYGWAHSKIIFVVVVNS